MRDFEGEDCRREVRETEGSWNLLSRFSSSFGTLCPEDALSVDTALMEVVSAEHRPFSIHAVYFKSVECSVVCDVDASAADARASEAKVWYAGWVSELTCPADSPSCFFNRIEHAVQRLVVDCSACQSGTAVA